MNDKLYKNPITGQTNTIKKWKEEYGEFAKEELFLIQEEEVTCICGSVLDHHDFVKVVFKSGIDVAKEYHCQDCCSNVIINNGKSAEANVQGVLRGGVLYGDLFVFHAGTMKIETREYSNLEIFGKEKL